MQVLVDLAMHVAELLDPGRRPMYADPAHVQHVVATQEREQEVLDDFGRAYVRDVRARIAEGRKPARPLTESRAQMLYFRDAARAKAASAR